MINVAVKKQRMGLPASAVERALADYAEQGIELFDTDALPQYLLARQCGFVRYDAAYLAGRRAESCRWLPSIAS